MNVFSVFVIFYPRIINTLGTNSLHLLKKRIRSSGIKYLITGHDSHQILRLGQIYDIVGPARYHVDSLYLVTANLELHRLVLLACLGVDTYLTLLDEAMSGNHYKKLPLRVMPMLTLRDPVHRYEPSVQTPLLEKTFDKNICTCYYRSTKKVPL